MLLPQHFLRTPEQQARAESAATTLVDDLRELSNSPLAYGQETHGEVHDDALLFVVEVKRLLAAVEKLPVELKDPAYAPDGGALQGAYNRVWCWLNSPVEEAKKL